MTSGTIEHLQQVERAIEELKQVLNTCSIKDDLRNLILIGMIDQLIEHHASVLQLIRSEKVGSAFALSRSIVEGLYRGLWINFCATDTEVETFEKEDKLPLKMNGLAKAIDDKYRAEGFFEDLRKRAWPHLCSYAHTGMLQLGRRFTGRALKPAYRDSEIVEITTSVTTCILTMTSKFLARLNLGEESLKAERLINTFGPAAELREAQAAGSQEST
ncbi:MAG TPA: hypothetical protein VJO35_10855 [Terriglobales bacterium]|nr:hypothetical protein [Terriglobales bacterium]